MKILLQPVLLIGLMTMCAHANAKGPTWDYIDATYTVNKLDYAGTVLNDIEVNGFGIELSKELSHEFFVHVEAELIDEEFVLNDKDSATLERLSYSAGIGYNHKVTNASDVYGILSFEGQNTEVKDYLNDMENNGYSFKLGFRSLPTSWFEFEGQMKYLDIAGESTTSLSTTLRFHINEYISVGAEYIHKEYEGVGKAGIRLSF